MLWRHRAIRNRRLRRDGGDFVARAGKRADGGGGSGTGLTLTDIDTNGAAGVVAGRFHSVSEQQCGGGNGGEDGQDFEMFIHAL